MCQGADGLERRSPLSRLIEPADGKKDELSSDSKTHTANWMAVNRVWDVDDRECTEEYTVYSANDAIGEQGKGEKS